MTRAALLSALLVTGCSSAPSPIDMTPRFVSGESRTESLECYAALRSVVDVTSHVGFSWKAKVLTSGPDGTTIDARMSRVVCKLPGLPAFDSDGVVPIGVTSAGELLLNDLPGTYRSGTLRLRLSALVILLHSCSRSCSCSLLPRRFRAKAPDIGARAPLQPMRSRRPRRSDRAA